MNKLYDSLTGLGTTENGALTFTTTGDAILNLFSMGGALRDRNEKEVASLIREAIKKEPLLAIKCIFYLRDIRGGQGERRFFRIALNLLEKEYPHFFEKIFKYVPEYGRWDDLFSMVNNKNVNSFLLGQFYDDLYEASKDKNVSLLGKWLPSINASSLETRKLAKIFIKNFNMSMSTYRKSLSFLREKIKIVEKQMSSNEWDKIDYSKVPSVAGMKYRKAFNKHDEKRYSQFIHKASIGEEKINTQTLYPSDIVKKIRTEGKNDTLEALWKNLPNYITDGEQALVVCDTSGSMSSCDLDTQPLDVALALTIYYAERNKNEIWKNHFITFSHEPQLQKIEGDTLWEKVYNLEKAQWSMNTNFNKVFSLILSRAKETNLSDKDMPKKIYVVSDMEFDSCGGLNTNFEMIKKNYREAGYTLPQLIFWNVNSKQNNVPVKSNEKGVALVSGYSPIIFKNLIGNKDLSPISIMLEVLNGKRYEKITI